MAVRPGLAPRKMRFLPLVAATFFMVSGGPYAIEDILGGAGFALSIIILLVLPIVWSLPTALMIGELASAIPAEGGFYIWVRRALGPFWGYQEGWLSLSASVFDMAIYPAFFISYLGKFNPALTNGWYGYAWKLGVVALCCAWNLRGAPAVGEDSVWMSALLLAPFGVFVIFGFWRGFTAHSAVQWSGPASGAGLSTAILVAMWNYMGWDNASTVAQEVENPQQAYPRAMIVSTLFVAIVYVLPLAAIAAAGLSVDSFSTGDWITAATRIGGPLLGMSIAAGGVITGVGMFNALVMSYTRLPMAMAEDGMLPRADRPSQQPRRALGQRSTLRNSVGAGIEPHVRAADHDRSHPLRIEPAAGVRRASGLANQGTGFGAAIQSRESRFRRSAGSRTGGIDRIRALRLAHRRGKGGIRLHFRLAFLPVCGTAGAGAVSSHCLAGNAAGGHRTRFGIVAIRRWAASLPLAASRNRPNLAAWMLIAPDYHESF